MASANAASPAPSYPMQGVGNLLHNDLQDRPAAIFGGRNRLHFEREKEPYLLLPIIPPKVL